MRAPTFLQTRVERLERAGAVRGIIAILSDPREKAYERAHAANALADMASRLGDERDPAVAILLVGADERTEARKRALLALAQQHETICMRGFPRAALDEDWMLRLFAAQ